MLALENEPMAVASTLDTILKMKDITMNYEAVKSFTVKEIFESPLFHHEHTDGMNSTNSCHSCSFIWTPNFFTEGFCKSLSASEYNMFGQVKERSRDYWVYVGSFLDPMQLRVSGNKVTLHY